MQMMDDRGRMPLGSLLQAWHPPAGRWTAAKYHSWTPWVEHLGRAAEDGGDDLRLAGEAADRAVREDRVTQDST